MKFKDNLRKVRKTSNFSQEKLAEEMSVSRQTISKWENGGSYPSTKHILELTKVLQCAYDELINGKSSLNNIKNRFIAVLCRAIIVPLSFIFAMIVVIILIDVKFLTIQTIARAVSIIKLSKLEFL